MIDLQRTEMVFVLTMQSGENRFNRRFLTALNGALDEVEEADGPAALVTVGEGKYYSNGLDLEWMSSQKLDTVSALISKPEFSNESAIPLSSAFMPGSGGGYANQIHIFRAR